MPLTQMAIAALPGAAPSLPRLRHRLLAWSGALETAWLGHPAARWTAKVFLDFACGVCAVIVTLAVDGNRAGFAPTEIARLAVAVGLLLGLAHVLRGSHRVIWRYTSLREASAVAVSAATVGVALLVGRWLGWVPFSGAVVLSLVLLTLFNALGLRALRRWQVTHTKVRRHARYERSPLRAPRRVLIVGAGRRGLSIGRELTERGTEAIELAGYLDDDLAKREAILNGARVLGRVSDALEVCDRYRIAEVIVAMPSAEPAFVRAFVRQLEDAGVRARAVQNVESFVDGAELHRPGAAKLHDLIGSTPGDERATPGGGHARRVLITGGAGYIGSHLVRMLLERGYHVRILDRFDYGRVGIEGLSHPNFEVIQGDICNSRDVSRAVRNVDGVIALAAIVGDPACNLDPEETVNLNYAGTKILAETCNFYGVRRLVFASSCSVYGASRQGLLTERSRRPRATSPGKSSTWVATRSTTASTRSARWWRKSSATWRSSAATMWPTPVTTASASPKSAASWDSSRNTWSPTESAKWPPPCGPIRPCAAGRMRGSTTCTRCSRRSLRRAGGARTWSRCGHSRKPETLRRARH